MDSDSKAVVDMLNQDIQARLCNGLTHWKVIQTGITPENFADCISQAPTDAVAVEERKSKG